jgi:uncharacterized protein
LDFFDCNCEIGILTQPPLTPAPTPEVLLREMEATGVQKALVRHTSQMDETPIVGNPYAVEVLAPYSNLLPTWTILPPQCRELGTVPEFIAGMGKAGVRALWAYPGKHNFLLNGETFGELFEEMTARRIPLFLRITEHSGSLTGWELCTDVLRQAPGLTLVLVGHGSWGHDRYFRPLIEKYPRFYVDTSRYELAGGIPDFCRTYGPERMLYGSAFPYTSMGAAMLTLLHCNMPDEYKAAVAGGNLERMLAEVKLT